MPLFSSGEMLLSTCPASFRAGCGILARFTWEGAWLCHAFPGEDGQQSLLTMCLNFSDLFPLIFPSGKWTIVPQWVGAVLE